MHEFLFEVMEITTIKLNIKTTKRVYISIVAISGEIEYFLFDTTA